MNHKRLLLILVLFALSSLFETKPINTKYIYEEDGKIVSSPTIFADSPIKYVVALMMENRSFDHLLGWLHEINPEIDGLTGAEYNAVNLDDPNSELVYVNKNGYNHSPDDPNHDFENTTRELFGVYYPYWDEDPSKTQPKCNGFVHNAYYAGNNISNPMSMFTNDSAPVINTLAMEFAVIDRWFASLPGPTDPNRGFVMSGTSNGMIENFNGTLWNQQSYFDFLTQNNITWNGFYQDDPWALYYFNDTVNNPENQQKIQHIDRFFANLKSGKLAQFTWLQPRMNPHITGPPTWQHPDALVSEGERLIKEIYEALRGSEFWNELAFVITYDEPGGFFDHVPPPQQNIPSPDNIIAVNGFNFERLGIRVPALVISPWVAKGTVVHDPPAVDRPDPTSLYDHTSIMSTTNYIFKIDKHLTQRDAWSGRFASLFTQLSSPRTDCPETLPSVAAWTYGDLQRQRVKPINDHQRIQVEFYCKFNHPQDKFCGFDVNFQYDSELFLQRELPVFLENIAKNKVLQQSDS